MRPTLYALFILAASAQKKNNRPTPPKANSQIVDLSTTVDPLDFTDTFILGPEWATTIVDNRNPPLTRTIADNRNSPLTAVVSSRNVQPPSTKSQIAVNPTSFSDPPAPPIVSTSTILDSTTKVSSVPLQIAVKPPQQSPKTDTVPSNFSTAAPNNSSSKILTILGITASVLGLSIVGIYIFRKTTLKKSSDFENRLNPDYVPSLSRSEKFKPQEFIERDINQKEELLEN